MIKTCQIRVLVGTCIGVAIGKQLAAQHFGWSSSRLGRYRRRQYMAARKLR